MAILIDRFFWNVDSTNRSSGTDSQFTIDIPLPADKQFKYVVMTDLAMPKTYYLFANGMNTFTLTEGATSVLVTIPPSNYLLQAFQATLQTLLRSKSPNSWTYTVGYPNIGTTGNTGMWTITVSNNTSQPSLSFTDHCYQQFGTEPNTTYPFVSNVFTSPNVIFMQAQPTVNIRTNMINDKQGILQTIHSSNTVDFGIITYDCSNPYFYARECKVPNTTCPQFWATDPQGNLLNLNSVNYNFTLEYFNISKWAEKQEDWIKLQVLEKEMVINENHLNNNNNNPQQ